ncbi:MAG: hypothetical protein R3B45_08000 [Bdellovibrionota bacterium]
MIARRRGTSSTVYIWAHEQRRGKSNAAIIGFAPVNKRIKMYKNLIFILTIFFTSQASAISLAPKTQAWLRLNSSASQMKLSPNGLFIAYTINQGKGLNIIKISSRKIWNISKEQIGPSFFWTPDGGRVVYREIGKTKDSKVESIVKIFDTKLKKSIIADHYPHTTGFLTFDPRDQKIFLMHEKGIHSKRLDFPNSRLARWQLAQKNKIGTWIATQNGILWVTQRGLSMRRMDDDGSPIESFDVSPDGQSIAWATQKGLVYTSTGGSNPISLGYGRDPDWHPRKQLLVYAGARMLGSKAIDYDIKMVDHLGRSRWLTKTQHSQERWPQWEINHDGIIYTKDKTTDLYIMEFRP